MTAKIILEILTENASTVFTSSKNTITVGTSSSDDLIFDFISGLNASHITIKFENDKYFVTNNAFSEIYVNDISISSGEIAINDIIKFGALGPSIKLLDCIPDNFKEYDEKVTEKPIVDITSEDYINSKADTGKALSDNDLHNEINLNNRECPVVSESGESRIQLVPPDNNIKETSKKHIVSDNANTNSRQESNNADSTLSQHDNRLHDSDVANSSNQFKLYDIKSAYYLNKTKNQRLRNLFFMLLYKNLPSLEKKIDKEVRNIFGIKTDNYKSIELYMNTFIQENNLTGQNAQNADKMRQLKDFFLFPQFENDDLKLVENKIKTYIQNVRLLAVVLTLFFFLVPCLGILLNIFMPIILSYAVVCIFNLNTLKIENRLYYNLLLSTLVVFNYNIVWWSMLILFWLITGNLSTGIATISLFWAALITFLQINVAFYVNLKQTYHILKKAIKINTL
jgi:hypothetical protein